MQEKIIILVEEAYDKYGSRLRERLEQASSEGSCQKPLRNGEGDKATEVKK